MKNDEKKDYINLIRWSGLFNSFNNYYFIKMAVIYLLFQGITPWVAVSIPALLDASRLLSRCFRKNVIFALKVNYYYLNIIQSILFLIICLIILQCRSIILIYILTIILGFISGIRNASVTAFNTTNKEYEAYLFIEEERSTVIGASLGLIFSQFIYDISPKMYIFSYGILFIINLVMNFNLKNVKTKDVMMEYDENSKLLKEDYKKSIITITLYGIMVGLWCIAVGAFDELAPLISNKVGYLNSVYTILETILLFFITGAVLQKIKRKKKLLFYQVVVAIIDVICLLIASVTLSWKGLLLAYIITSFSSTLGDPLWGSIMSAYSFNDRKVYVLITKVYFIIRTIFSIITIIICRECIIRGVETFKYLALVLLGLIILFYFIINKYNKKFFNTTI